MPAVLASQRNLTEAAASSKRQLTALRQCQPSPASLCGTSMCSSPLPMHLRTTGEPQAPGRPAAAESVEGHGEAQSQQQPDGQEKRGKARQQPVAKAVNGGKAARRRAAPADEQQWQVVQQKQEERRGGQSLTALTALGTVALYASVRGSISLFHHARRRQLSQLLHDLADALSDLGATWWLDFGR